METRLKLAYVALLVAVIEYFETHSLKNEEIGHFNWSLLIQSFR